MEKEESAFISHKYNRVFPEKKKNIRIYPDYNVI